LFRRPKLTLSCSAEEKEGPYVVGGTFTHVTTWEELYETFPTRSRNGPIVGSKSVVVSMTGEGRTVFVWTFNCLCIEDDLEIHKIYLE
jgi:hypothetical protein